ncbi:hypothetical protein HanPSC8_Chr09g0357061 [Helianthus annuus]|nr:hypothetical protein HanPSC8_Chr09g0357061 [Helianthus annuus]
MNFVLLMRELGRIEFIFFCSSLPFFQLLCLLKNYGVCVCMEGQLPYIIKYL